MTETDKICPYMSANDPDNYQSCAAEECGIWDVDRKCCSFNTKKVN